MLLHAPASSFTLTSGATEANNIALLGQQIEDDNRTEILISALEHDSVWNCAPILKNKGFNIKIIPTNPEGFITPDAVERAITDNTKLVSVMAANHEIGTIQPLAEISDIAHKHGALFHCDAAQATGKIPLNITDLDIDLLSLSGHKFYGPMGIGALYIRAKPALQLHPISCGGQQQKRRSGTLPVPLAVGLGVAADIAQNRMQQDQEHLQNLTTLLLRNLERHSSNIQWNGNLKQRLPGSLNLTLNKASAEDFILDNIDTVSVSTGSACGTSQKKPSRSLQAIGLSDEDIHRSLRLSMGRQTREEDIKIITEKLIPYLG